MSATRQRLNDIAVARELKPILGGQASGDPMRAGNSLYIPAKQ